MSKTIKSKDSKPTPDGYCPECRKPMEEKYNGDLFCKDCGLIIERRRR